MRLPFRAAAPDPQPDPPDAHVLALSERLDAAAQQRLGRSLAVLHLQAGDCGGCALELQAVDDLPYGLAQYGLRSVATPLQADVLLVTGVLTRTLREAVERALLVMPEPRWVVAIGDCAAGAGPFAESYAVAGGVAAAVPVDLVVQGCPPEPSVILAGLRALLEAQVPRRARREPRAR